MDEGKLSTHSNRSIYTSTDNTMPPSPSVHDWVVYKDGSKAYVGVVVSVEKKSIHIHAFAHSPSLKRLTACWQDDELREKLSDKPKARWLPSTYLIDRDNIIGHADRENSSEKFKLPLSLARVRADFNRDPHA
jgi:hypothetical protein